MDGVCRDVIRYLVFGMFFSIAMASVCTRDGFFGDNCDYECHCDGGKPCDKQTGVCPGVCASGWDGEYCQRGNAAQGKPSLQSTTWASQTAHYGNDGSQFTSFTNCANTQYQSEPWWKVDLGKDYVIFRVLLLNSGGDVRTCRRTVNGTEYTGSVSTTSGNRYTCKEWSYTWFANKVPSGSSNYCRNPDNVRKPWCYTTSSSKRWDFCDIPLCQQLHFIKLWVDSKEIYYYQGYTAYASLHTIGFQSPPVGRQITIGQTTTSSLTLCELHMDAFQYRACTDKRYGPNCNNRCQCANDTKCDDKTGKCPPGCNDRFTGPYCNIEIPTFSQVGSSTPTSIKFQWRYIRSHDSAYNAGTVTKYVLRYSYKTGSTSSYGVSSPSGTVEANVTGLKPSTRYSFGLRVEYTVASSTAWNEGNPSRHFSTASCSGYVSTPTITVDSKDLINVNLAKPDRAYIHIHTAVTGMIPGCFQKMDVYYKRSTTGTFISVASFTNQQGIKQTVEKLTPYTIYDIKAVVTSPDGITKESTSTVKTSDDFPPAPTVIEASASRTTISIRVIPPDLLYGNITQYKLQWWKESGTPETNHLPTNGLTVIYRKLAQSAKYHFRAQATTSKGWGDWSTQITIVTRETVPGPPKTMESKYVTKTSLKLIWTEPEFPSGDLKDYKVMCTPVFSYDKKVANDLEKNVLKADPGPKIKEWKFTKLTPATKYNCSVSAQTSKGYGGSTWEEIWTKAEKPEVPEQYFPKVSASETTETSITIQVKKIPSSLNFGKIRNLRIAVEKQISSNRRKRSAPLQTEDHKKLTDYQTAKNEQYLGYIAAELPADFEGPFIIGDGKTYGGYENPSLKKGEKYDVIFGMEFVVNNETAVAYRRYGQFITVGGHDQGSNVGLIVGMIVLVLVILAAVIIPVVIILRRKRQQQQKKDPRLAGTELTDVTANTAGTEETATRNGTDSVIHDDTYQGFSNQIFQSDRSILISSLAGYVKAVRGERKAEFNDEFEELPKDDVKPVVFARKQGNSVLNRYRNIISYDHSRVVLKPIKGERRDYINASFIHGYDKKNVYIASQGPLPKTTSDMWRMIWQQRCRVVVMLTKLEEKGKRKCTQYWPDEEPEAYGPFTVQRVEECSYTDYVKNVFKVTLDGEERTLKYFHFTAWPDHGVPKFASSLLNFRVAVLNEAEYGKTPILVHCSAGCGRTGTFIGIDYLIRQGIAEKKVNVFECVLKMRDQRTNMVQNIDQYLHLHDAILEFFEIGLTYIQSESFPEKYAAMVAKIPGKSTNKLQEQYTILGAFTTSITPAKEALMHVSRNRNKKILPAASSRVVLSLPVNGWDDYVNAVYATGYGEKDKYVITQMPFPDTMKDLWRIVLDTGIPTIVMMNVIDDTYELSPVYWPTTGERMEFGPIVVETLNTDTSSNNIIVRDLKISVMANQRGKGGVEGRKVRHFQLQNWRDGELTPTSPESIVELLDMVERWRPQVGNKKLLVQCLDGSSQSGVFCVAHSVIEKVKVDHEVDVFQYLRLLRTSRPQLVNTYEQYKFIHDIVLKYLKGFDIYANFQ